MLLADRLCDPSKAYSQQKNFSYFAPPLATLQWQATFISIIFSLIAGAWLTQKKGLWFSKGNSDIDCSPGIPAKWIKMAKCINKGFSCISSILIFCIIYSNKCFFNVFMFGLTRLIWWCNMGENIHTAPDPAPKGADQLLSSQTRLICSGPSTIASPGAAV